MFIFTVGRVTHYWISCCMTLTLSEEREDKERPGSVYFIIIYSRYSFVLKLNKEDLNFNTRDQRKTLPGVLGPHLVE